MQWFSSSDVNVDFPDEKSVMTYVAAYYHHFAKMKTVEVSGTRIGKVIERIKENEILINEYEVSARDLLQWIEITITKLSDRTYANTLVGVQQQMLEFNQYRTQEKPPRYSRVPEMGMSVIVGMVTALYIICTRNRDVF